jgi:hypothetical protein
MSYAAEMAAQVAVRLLDGASNRTLILGPIFGFTADEWTFTAGLCERDRSAWPAGSWLGGECHRVVGKSQAEAESMRTAIMGAIAERWPGGLDDPNTAQAAASWPGARIARIGAEAERQRRLYRAVRP